MQCRGRSCTGGSGRRTVPCRPPPALISAGAEGLCRDPTACAEALLREHRLGRDLRRLHRPRRQRRETPWVDGATLSLHELGGSPVAARSRADRAVQGSSGPQRRRKRSCAGCARGERRRWPALRAGRGAGGRSLRRPRLPPQLGSRAGAHGRVPLLPGIRLEASVGLWQQHRSAVLCHYASTPTSGLEGEW
jgi:hypothetical protein